MNLQEQVNAASAGAIIQHDTEYVGNLVIDKPLTVQGTGIIRTPNADPAVLIPPKTGPVVLRGLEITTDPNWPQVHDLIRFGDDKTTVLADAPQGLTVESCDVHGQPNQASQRGISANGANLKVIKSKVREIHGRGYDTQAVCCWNGPGPFLFEDSYFEAAGENVMFGGSLASIPNLVPTGIQIRRCVFFKPLAWRGVWTVKNNFELKNARNVIVEGCVFDGCWTDAQTGRAIQFTPRPSDSGHWAVIEDVQFINNIIRNTGAGLNVLGADEPPAPTETRLRRVRIANNVWEIDGARFGSDGVFLVITNRTEDVTVENNTVIHNGNIISTDYAPNTRFIYRYNISRHNTYGIFGSGASTGNATIDQYFPGGIVTGNVMAKEGDAPGNVELVYPAGNRFPESLAAVGFVDLAAGDYRLADSSPYKGAGADMEALTAAIGGTSAPTPIPEPPQPDPIPPPAEPAPTDPLTPSPDGFKGTKVVDGLLSVWTLGSSPEFKTLRDGIQMGGGQGKEYKWLNQTVYVLGLDSNWYKWAGSWVGVGPVEPGASAPQPEPQPTPTPEPTPIPTPVPEPLPPPEPAPPAPPRIVKWPTSLDGQMALIQVHGREGYRPSGRLVPRPTNMPKGNYTEFIGFK